MTGKFVAYISLIQFNSIQFIALYYIYIYIYTSTCIYIIEEKSKKKSKRSSSDAGLADEDFSIKPQSETPKIDTSK